MKKISLTKKIAVVIIALFSIILTFGFVYIDDRDFKIAKNLDIFFTLFRELNMYYVDETDPEKLISSSINGMLKSLDPYTSFIPESEMDDFAFMTTGEYGGIGALIRKAGKMTIISEPYEGFPAQKAGLKAGDTIVSIDGQLVENKSVSEVSEMLKGTPGTSLKLKISRFGNTGMLEKTLSREKITIKNVPYYGILQNNTGYIRLANFTKDAGTEVRNALINLKKQNISSVILDVRGNPGGLLIEAVNVSNVFIGKGKEIVSTKGKVKQWDNTYKTKELAVDTTLPLVVLVDRGSASASEIVAGAMQDYDRAVIAGQRTFGKGLVQTTRPLSYNTQLKVTTAKYYIPSGRCIQALDYTHRNDDGSVGYIPDSLISEFKTRNGRKVYDGGGITPDLIVEDQMPSQIAISLYTKNLLFDYATIFAAKYGSITSIDSFNLSDNVYNDFVSFLSNQDFDYTTNSDKKFEELIKVAQQEKYYDHSKIEFDALAKKIAHDKNKDLVTFKDEITEYLTEEIISRYYYQEGRIRASLRNDQQVKKAIEIASGKKQYQKLLSPNEEKEILKDETTVHNDQL
ncbi:MAG: S41 family peptidase [Bacteroidales bacterium]|nr:S41 family peptidase [Bacteroidales bacterium]